MNGDARRVEVMHGVNLDQLGRRDPALYGTLTLPDLERRIEADARELGLRTRFFQTNHEGAFVERLHGPVPFVLVHEPGDVAVEPGVPADHVAAAVAELVR